MVVWHIDLVRKLIVTSRSRGCETSFASPDIRGDQVLNVWNGGVGGLCIIVFNNFRNKLI